MPVPMPAQGGGGGVPGMLAPPPPHRLDHGLLAQDDKETRRWRRRMAWLRDPNEVGSVKEQLWILFHVLFFLHCEKREEIKAREGVKRKGALRSLFCWRV